MKGPEVKPVVELVGQDGNAFNLLSIMRKALRKAGADTEYVQKFTDEATAGDYDNLLQVCMEYAEVE